MTITNTSSTVSRRGFCINSAGDDWDGAETILAAQGAGTHIYLERIHVSSETAQAITIGEGNAGTAVTTVLVGPLYMAATGNIEISFPHPIQLTANTILAADSADNAEDATIVVQGYVE